MLYCKALRKIRKERNVTETELARWLNKTRETVSAWENGKYQPCAANIRLIAQLFNIPVCDISDLQEIRIKNNNTSKQNISDLDVSGLEPETAAKLKSLHETCLELMATNTRLRSNLFKYDTLLQSLPFIIYVKDKKLKYTYGNEKFLALLNRSYGSSSISGVSSFDIFGMTEYSQVLELEQKVLQTKHQLSGQQIYIPGTLKKRIGMLTIIPIIKDNKEVEELICSIEDIIDTHKEEKRQKASVPMSSIVHFMTELRQG